MRSIGRSFRLVKVCFHVLSVDKELMVFPLLSSIALVFVSLSFLGVGVGVGALDRLAAGGTNATQPVDLVVGFLFYFVSYFVIIFFNSALVYAAHYRLAGGDPNVATGLRGAMQHLPAIILWSLVSAIVGLILRMLSNRGRSGGMGIVGQIVISIMGAAWTLVTYFVVPLIVIEGRSFTGSFKASLSMFRRTWGEQVVGNFGLGMAAVLVTIVAALVLGLLFFVLSPLGSVGVGIVVVLGVATMATIALVFATLDGIYKAALYRYASTGQVPELFPDDVVRDGWRQQEGGGGGPFSR